MPLCYYTQSLNGLWLLKFLPRDDVLVRYMLSLCVCPSVRLFVRSTQAGIVQ